MPTFWPHIISEIDGVLYQLPKTSEYTALTKQVLCQLLRSYFFQPGILKITNQPAKQTNKQTNKSSQNWWDNVCFIKFCSKHSSTEMCLLQNLMKQMLLES